ATKHTNEHERGDNAGGRSVWFQWTAPNGGAWTFDTTGSNFDTLLAIYIGTDVGALTDVVSNDDESATVRTSRVTFNAIAGTAYRVAVDGFNPNAGEVDTAGDLADVA